jgi:hypothetical protein
VRGDPDAADPPHVRMIFTVSLTVMQGQKLIERLA